VRIFHKTGGIVLKNVSSGFTGCISDRRIETNCPAGFKFANPITVTALPNKGLSNSLVIEIQS
jgi:hypothetical protein